MYAALRALAALALVGGCLVVSAPADAQDVTARPGELRPVLSIEEQQNAQALAAQGHELVFAYRVLEVATAAMLATTAVFGAFQLYNLPTSFGVGACEGDNNPIFDDY